MTLDELDKLAAEKVILVIIPEWPQYAADTDGNIWRLKDGWQSSLPKKCAAYTDRNGYQTVRIWNGSKYIAKKCHALVCSAFNGPRPTPKHATRHLNGIRSDNRPTNLIWGTQKENAADRIRHGTAIFGEKNHSAKLTSNDIPKIFEMRKSGLLIKDIAPRFGVTNETIRKVLIGKTWKNVRACLRAKGVEV